MSFWITQPSESVSGTVSFAGIIPGGFEGAASSVLSLWFTAISPGTASLSLGDVTVLLNDGEGTPAKTTTQSATITISSGVSSGTSSVAPSYISPELFTPIVSSDPNVFGGQFFLSFATTDKGSGIDHYEVLEAPTGRNSTGNGGVSNWQVATSPYLLRDQTLSSDIYVRAVDHAGNFIIVKVPAAHPQKPIIGLGGEIPIPIQVGGTLLVCLIVLALIWWFRRRRLG